MVNVRESANFGVDRLIGARCAGKWNLAFPSETYIAYNNLPCTTVQACDKSELACCFSLVPHMNQTSLWEGRCEDTYRWEAIRRHPGNSPWYGLCRCRCWLQYTASAGGRSCSNEWWKTASANTQQFSDSAIESVAEDKRQRYTWLSVRLGKTIELGRPTCSSVELQRQQSAVALVPTPDQP
jgi:hypothetical protein